MGYNNVGRNRCLPNLAFRATTFGIRPIGPLRESFRLTSIRSSEKDSAMKARQTIKSLLFAAVALGAMTLQSASASTYGFMNITNNGNSDLSSQLSVEVLAVGAQASFKFLNNVGIASSITDIYFDDVTSPLFNDIVFSAASSGVSFDNSANPGNLPGGNSIGFNADYSGDSTSPVSHNGVNSSSEWVTFVGTFAGGNDFNGLIAALNNNTFRIGLHVQAIGQTGGSDSYVSAVPLPAAAWLFGSALFGFMMVSNRRKV